MKRSMRPFLSSLVMLILISSAALAQDGSSQHHHVRANVSDIGGGERKHPRHQHGDDHGHLPASQENVELVGKLEVTDVPGRIADVGVLGNFAYLAAFYEPECRDGGVYVVDISDPTKPTNAGFIPTTPGSFVGEGVQGITLSTPSFQGDVLVYNNEICGDGGLGGVSLWDVSDPRNPVPLAEHRGDDSDDGVVNQIHSSLAWQDGNRAFVVLVDDEELRDVDILEITDPRNPVLIAETGITLWPDDEDIQAYGIGDFPASFFHDVQVKRVQGHMIMLLSYWDKGWVLLNVDDPANPQFIRDSDFPDPDPLTGFSPPEGNAHQAEFSHNNRYIIGTTEDFAPFRVERAQVTSGPYAGKEFPAAQSSFAPITDRAPLEGTTYYVGRACDPASVPAAPATFAIALIERGECSFFFTAQNILAAGYDAAITFNTNDPDEFRACELTIDPYVTQDVPFVFVSRSAGYALLGIAYDPATCFSSTAPPLPDIGTQGAEVRVEARFDGWGDVHLLDGQTLAEVGAYAIDEARDTDFAIDFGALSVHEVAVDPSQNLGYLSYYAGGFRVVTFGAFGIKEVGHYITEGGNDFWGVQVYKPQGSADTLILASDRDSGLWIFRYTGTCGGYEGDETCDAPPVPAPVTGPPGSTKLYLPLVQKQP